MPRKIRQLLKDYKKAGFVIVKREGKGDRKKLSHAIFNITRLLDGQDGDDAKHYQEKQLQTAIAETRQKEQNP